MRQIAVLAVVFVVLLVAVIAKELSRPAASALRDQVPLVPVAVTPFTEDDVEEIVVSGDSPESSFTLAKRDGRYRVEQPFAAPADAGAVTQLIEAFSGARAELRLDDAAALEKFGLGEGAVRVEMKGAGGTVLADAEVGRSSGEVGCFVRLLAEPSSADSAYAVGADLRGALGLARSLPGSRAAANPKPDHFHDKNFPIMQLDEISTLEIVTPLRRFVLAPKGDGWDVVEGGPELPVNADAVERVVRQLRAGFQARALADPARKSELGFDEPGYRVTVTLPDGAKRGLVAVADAEAKTFHARLAAEQDPDVVYEIANQQWSLVFPAGSSLFRLPGLGLGEGEPESLTATGPDGVIRMVRGPDGDWTLETPDWGLLEPRASALRNLEGLLRNLKPTDWSDAASAGEAQVSIAYGPSADAVDALPTIRIGGASATGKGRLAVFPNAPERVVVLDDATVGRLAPPAFDLFERELFPGRDGVNVERVDVRPLPGTDGEAFTLLRRASVWTLVRGESETAAAEDAAESWAERLVGMAAESVAEEPGEPTHVLVLASIGKAPVTLGMRRDGDEAVIYLGNFDATPPQVAVALRVAEADLLPAAATFEVPAKEGGGEDDDDEETDDSEEE